MLPEQASGKAVGAVRASCQGTVRARLSNRSGETVTYKLRVGSKVHRITVKSSAQKKFVTQGKARAQGHVEDGIHHARPAPHPGAVPGARGPARHGAAGHLQLTGLPWRLLHGEGDLHRDLLVVQSGATAIAPNAAKFGQGRHQLDHHLAGGGSNVEERADSGGRALGAGVWSRTQNAGLGCVTRSPSTSTQTA